MLLKISVDQALIKAEKHIKKNEIQEAKKLYQAILVSFPQDKRIQHALATLKNLNVFNYVKNQPKKIINKMMALYEKGHYLGVIEHVKVFVKQFPEEFIIWNIIGVSAFQIGMLN